MKRFEAVYALERAFTQGDVLHAQDGDREKPGATPPFASHVSPFTALNSWTGSLSTAFNSRTERRAFLGRRRGGKGSESKTKVDRRDGGLKMLCVGSLRYCFVWFIVHRADSLSAGAVSCQLMSSTLRRVVFGIRLFC